MDKAELYAYDRQQYIKRLTPDNQRLFEILPPGVQRALVLSIGSPWWTFDWEHGYQLRGITAYNENGNHRKRTFWKNDSKPRAWQVHKMLVAMDILRVTDFTIAI